MVVRASPRLPVIEHRRVLSINCQAAALPAGQCKRHDSTIASLLSTGQRMLRVGFETGIVHRADTRLLLQPASDLQGIGAMLMHAQ